MVPFSAIGRRTIGRVASSAYSHLLRMTTGGAHTRSITQTLVIWKPAHSFSKLARRSPAGWPARSQSGTPPQASSSTFSPGPTGPSTGTGSAGCPTPGGTGLEGRSRSSATTKRPAKTGYVRCSSCWRNERARRVVALSDPSVLDLWVPDLWVRGSW